MKKYGFDKGFFIEMDNGPYMMSADVDRELARLRGEIERLEKHIDHMTPTWQSIEYQRGKLVQAERDLAAAREALQAISKCANCNTCIGIAKRALAPAATAQAGKPHETYIVPSCYCTGCMNLRAPSREEHTAPAVGDALPKRGWPTQHFHAPLYDGNDTNCWACIEARALELIRKYTNPGAK